MTAFLTSVPGTDNHQHDVIPTTPVDFSGAAIPPPTTDASGNVVVVGTVAAGVASAGNSVAMGAVYKTAPPSLTDGQRADLITGSSGNLRIEIGGTNSTTYAAVSAPSADGVATSSGALSSRSFSYGYNSSTMDRLRTIQGAKSVSTGLGVLAIEAAGRPSSHITTATTTTAVSGAGTIESLDVCKGVAASTITVYDSLSASGTVLAVIDSTVATVGWLRNRAFATGLTIVTSGATDINVSYRS